MAKIDGPDQVPSGKLTLFHLNGQESLVADWTILSRVSELADPVRDVDWIIYDNGRSVAFATPVPGRYLVICAVYDPGDNAKKVNILVHSLTVGEPLPPPPPPPPPTPPNPTPNKDWSDAARDLATQLVPKPRAEEAKTLAAAMKEVAATFPQLNDLRKARERLREATRTALGEKYTRWLQWSEAIANILEANSAKITTVAEFQNIVNSIAAGLEQVRD
ncbi:MAG: hypothetical protein ACPL7K_04870 [Armatimonadota bacterium]